MKIKFHTMAAVVVLVVSGLWVATGKYTFVGSDIAEIGQASAATTETPAPDPAKADPADGRQTVGFVVAQPSAYDRRIRLAGQTKADKQVTLVSRASGAIAELAVSQGDRVAENALIMALDAPDKLAAVVSAQSQFDTAVHQAETSQQLFDKGSMPKLQYEATIAAREATRSGLEAAQAEVDRLQVHAPFAGIIDRVAVEAGSWVQPGSEVATLLALDPIVVVGEIGERDLQAVTKGTKATVIFGDGSTAEGVVRYVRREASGLTRTFPIEVAIANPDAAIPSGMSAEIDLLAQTAPSVILPRSVVTLDPDGNLGVRVLTDSDTVAFVKVAIVDDTPEGMVLSGIPAGARIIVSGQNMVSEGQSVVAVQAKDAAAAAGGSD
jgi:membrane fusion protein, multidrug efflux system